MDALIERFSSQMFRNARKIAADKSLTVNDRIIQVILSLNVSDTTGKEMIEHMHKPQNALMHQKIQKMIISGVTPILTNIIQEGIEQGLCSTPYPYECMEMILVYANTVFDDDDMVTMTEESRATRIQAFIFNMERLLGAKEGSFVKDLMRIFDSKN